MSFHDPVNKRQADDESESRNNQRDWYKRSPEAFSQAEAHYSNRLADAFESITCERLLEHDPSIESLLHETSLLTHVKDFPIPGSAIAFPRKDQKGRILYGFTWERIESMSPEQLGLELFEKIFADLEAGKIG